VVILHIRVQNNLMCYVLEGHINVGEGWGGHILWHSPRL